MLHFLGGRKPKVCERNNLFHVVCMSVLVLTLLTLLFSFISATTSQKPVWIPFKHSRPEMILYLTNGQTIPPYDPLYQVQIFPDPEIDNRVAFFDSKDMNKFLTDLTALERDLSPGDRNLGFEKLLEKLDEFPNHVKLAIQYWQAINPDAHYLERRPIRDFIRAVKTSRARQYPTRLQEVYCNSCFKNDFNRMLSPKMKCKDDETVDLVALITTTPQALDARQSVRKTWGSWSRNNTSNFRAVFLMGKWPENINQKLKEENDLYGDILQDDFIDHYYNLTYKAIMAYKWGTDICPKAKFFLRAADDTFVNVPQLIHFLHKHENAEAFKKYQIGYCSPAVEVPRQPESRTYVSTLEYKYKHFLPYAMGTTVLTSSDLTRKIYEKSTDVRYNPIEDAYLGFILKSLDSGCLHNFGFNVESANNIKKPFFYTSHMETPETITQLFEKFKDCPPGREP